MSDHHIGLTVSRGYLDVEFICTAEVGAACRGKCAEECSAWLDGDGCGCPRSDSGECQQLVWMQENDADWTELYDGGPAEVKAGDVEFIWDGDQYLWRYER